MSIINMLVHISVEKTKTETSLIFLAKAIRLILDVSTINL